MTYYRNMTFCPFWRKCRKGKGCLKSLTDIIKSAHAEWGNGSTLAQYRKLPKCYKEGEE